MSDATCRKCHGPWVITYLAQPWSANAARRLHWRAEAKLVKQWRTDVCWLAKAQRIPTMERVRISGKVSQQRGVLADQFSYAPAFKAAVDGLVDAGVVADDDQTHVELHLLPPIRGPWSMNLTIEEMT